MVKSELRELYKAKRKALPPGELERLSETIVEQTLTHFQLDGKIISLFLPIERHREINTYLLWERAMNVGATVAVPKTNFETLEMRHYLFEQTDQLELNEKGIPEPKKGKVVAADRFDIVFVPLLAVDKKETEWGTEKGSTTGFYVNVLLNVFLSGCIFFDLESKIEDVLPTDVRLNAVVTPTKVFRFD